MKFQLTTLAALTFLGLTSAAPAAAAVAKCTYRCHGGPQVYETVATITLTSGPCLEGYWGRGIEQANKYCNENIEKCKAPYSPYGCVAW
ncbi:uncharacterized protein EV422DRAFT_564581 [Fimicolochytrium jonesii]|uniref:uncharacterized protein n=1 Tax=Fimicolochytrium jonesii TaxID=1396493 RepID=UPI0022FE2919|nr:uncharacterized protein EV422DRAFT_564581 [Fimicolochytrium jonesii]KAI8825252.1 hypothetical protein EV422DRAFT_564581 [Fimicolochytrium jonesii]